MGAWGPSRRAKLICSPATMSMRSRQDVGMGVSPPLHHSFKHRSYALRSCGATPHPLPSAAPQPSLALAAKPCLGRLQFFLGDVESQASSATVAVSLTFGTQVATTPEVLASPFGYCAVGVPGASLFTRNYRLCPHIFAPPWTTPLGT